MSATVLNLLREPDPDDGFRLVQLRARIATAIANGRRSDETLADLCSFVADRVKDATVLIATLDRADTLRVRASDAPPQIQQLIHGTKQHSWFGSWGATLTRGTPTIVAEVAASSLYREHRALLIDLHLLGAISLPIVGRLAQTTGSLIVYLENARILDADERDLLNEVASLASLAVQADERVQHLLDRIRHDPLTGLENRDALDEHLQRAIEATVGNEAKLALLFIDIDDLTLVNDSLGHTTGDAVIAITAERIQSQLLPSDLVVRFGGDEFIVVLERIDSVEDAVAAATRLRRCIGDPITIQGTELQTTVSIGITIGGPDKSPLQLIDEGHAAVVRAKQSGDRDSTATHDSSLDTGAGARLSREVRLREAIDNDEFVLYWQPKVTIETGVVAGAEALLRWEHPDDGIIGPDAFLHTAERAGLIGELTNWVIRQALAETKSFRSVGREFFAAVNLSASQLDRIDIVAQIADALELHRAPPESLTIELTESVLASPSVIERLHELDQLGVHLAIDDFGTGYSSLAYVHQLPVGTVKIDRAFIEGLTRTGDGAPILQAAISMAQALGMTTTIEGVETDDQFQGLYALGATLAQGYLFSEPVPIRGLEELLR